MKKIGLKLFQPLEYDVFEPLQYWLDYDFEYDELIEAIEHDEVIALDLEEDEDRAEDIEMLKVFLARFEEKGIAFKLFELEEDLREIGMEEIG